jgi:hypothetical protein
MLVSLAFGVVLTFGCVKAFGVDPDELPVSEECDQETYAYQAVVQKCLADASTLDAAKNCAETDVGERLPRQRRKR